MAKKAAHKPDNLPKQNFLQSPWLLGLFLILAVVFAYQPAWHAGFIWDDDEYVTDNPLLTAPDGLWRIWFSTDSPSQYFPLTYTVFRIEHALWGFNSTGYHLVNIFLHAINSLLVWQLLKRLAIPGAWLAAAIFALHPVQVESVAWVTECKNVLMCFFFLLTLRCWIEFIETPKWQFYFAALILFALALFSKTTACTLPAALLLILWIKHRPINWQRLLQVVPFVVIGIGMGLLTIWWERHHQGTQGKIFSLGLTERVLVASHAIWFYAGKLLWPTNLIFSYPKWTIHPNDLLAYGWLAALTGLCVVIYFLRRVVGRSVETATLFYVATLSPMLGFIMLYTFRYTFVADHYQYVACLGLIAVASAGITIALNKHRFLKLIVCGGLLLTLGMLTWRHCRICADQETLWRATVARNPTSWMAYDNLGAALSLKGHLDEAIIDFQKSLNINPDDAEAHSNLGFVLLQKGQAAEAVVHFQRAIEISPNMAAAYNHLGLALFQMGRMTEAIDHYQKALAIKPDFAQAHNNLGDALVNKGQMSEAVVHYQQALKINSNYAEAHNGLGFALYHLGRTDEAVVHYQKAVKIIPDFAIAHNNLGFALSGLGRIDEAIIHFQKALEINPAFHKARFNLGTTFLQKGRIDEAIILYQKVVENEPDNTEAQNNLGLALFKKGRLEEAITHYRRSLEIDPSNAFAHSNLGLALFKKGQIKEATASAQQALQLANEQNNATLAATIQTQIKTYQTNSTAP